MIILGILLYVIILAIAPNLPDVAQRAISFVPNIQVSERVAADAEGSVEWRIEIWEYCLSQVKDYLLIGRGSAFGFHKPLATVRNLSRKLLIII